MLLKKQKQQLLSAIITFSLSRCENSQRRRKTSPVTHGFSEKVMSLLIVALFRFTSYGSEVKNRID